MFKKTGFVTSFLIILAIFSTPSMLDGQHFGLGIILGAPTGFNFKLFLTQRSAVSISAGWSLSENAGFHATGDYQFLFPTKLKWQDEFEGTTTEINNLVPYLGIGGRLKFQKQEPPADDMEINVGVRMGGGVEILFSQFGVFLEIYPVVNVIPATDFDMEGGVGFRFYFK